MGKARPHWREPQESQRRGAASLANLRPVSADPEKLRKLPSLFGSPTAKHKLCGAPCKGTQAPEKRGKPCRRVASYGTDRCVKHGARALAGLPPSPRELAVKAAFEVLESNPPPPELTRQEAWRRNEQERKTFGDRQIRRAALVKAWMEGVEKGQWKQWQATINR
jgi:hypothetical protein